MSISDYFGGEENLEIIYLQTRVHEDDIEIVERILQRWEKENITGIKCRIERINRETEIALEIIKGLDLERKSLGLERKEKILHTVAVISDMLSFHGTN